MRTNMDVELSNMPMPPGTVHLEDILASKVILHPTPSNDPNDPLNWSSRRKACNFGLVCLYILMAFTVLDIPTVVYGAVRNELGFTFEQQNRAYALSTAGLGIGSIIFLPFAFKFGRRPVYLLSITILLARSVWQARMQTLGDLYGSNIISGLAGSIAETLCSVTLADLFFVHQRGSLTNIYTITLNTGAFLAPVAAGYSATSQGWRWIWWWSSIFLGMTLFLFIVFYEETIYTPVLNGSIQGHGQVDGSNESKSNCGTEHRDDATTHCNTAQAENPPKSYLERLAPYTIASGSFINTLRHVYQPFIILVSFPGVTYVALVYGSLLAWLAIALNVLAADFTLPPYNFSASSIGLFNLAPFVGSLIGGLYGGPLSDWLILWLTKRNNGIYHPEFRLWLGLPIVIILPAGYLMFGLGTGQGIQWYVPAIGLGMYGVGLGALGNGSLTYLVDSYKDLVGDGMVGVIFVRNALATLTSTCLSPWVSTMGLRNMFIVSGCLSIAILLLTVPMIIWGRKCREWTAKRYMTMAAKQSDARMKTTPS